MTKSERAKVDSLLDYLADKAKESEAESQTRNNINDSAVDLAKCDLALEIYLKLNKI